MGKTVVMADIAKKLNISNVTVSKALADKEGVSEELREKIKQVANEIGYRYNSAAKSLKEGLNYNIGIIIPERYIDVGASFYWQMYKKVADELMKSNYYAVFEMLKTSDEQQSVMPKMVNDSKVDGVIVLGQVKKDYFNMIKSIPVPVVFMDFYEKDNNQDFIVTDNVYSMYLLTSHLIEMGHKDIGFVGNMKSTSSIQDRYLGYMKALIENDIDIAKCQKWYISDRTNEGEYIDLELPETLPTAFVSNCDKMAYELIGKLSKEGYRVPEDISVVGFDNYVFSMEGVISVTTVEVDMKTMAQAAVDIVLKRINNAKIGRGIRQISGKIIYKDSVKKIG